MPRRTKKSHLKLRAKLVKTGLKDPVVDVSFVSRDGVRKPLSESNSREMYWARSDFSHGNVLLYDDGYNKFSISDQRYGYRPRIYVRIPNRSAASYLTDNGGRVTLDAWKEIKEAVEAFNKYHEELHAREN